MTQAKTVRDHFQRTGADGSYARFYDASEPLVAHDFLQRMRRAEELLGPYRGPERRVLGVGCGTGPMIPYFCSIGTSYHGVDVAQAMLDSIERRFRPTPYWPLIELQVGSSDRIPYSSERFDLVEAMGLLEYLDDIRPSLQEIRRVIKPRGVALVTVPNRRCLNRLMMRHSGSVTRWHHSWTRTTRTSGRDGIIVRREYSPHFLDQAMTTTGFTKIGHAFYDYKLLCYPLTRLLPRLCFAVNRRIENRVSYLFANGYIGLYQKIDDPLSPRGDAS